MNTRTTLLFTALAMAFICPALFAQDQEIPPRSIITPKSYTISVSNLGPDVNSSDDEFAPCMVGTGRVMYFTSSRDGSHDIYTTVGDGSAWNPPIKLGVELNTDLQEGGISITPDGHWMVFVGCDREGGYGDCDLYMAEYIGGLWRNIRNLGATVNSPSWDSQPSISPDGLTVYFASNRPGGQGGTDIWMTTRSFGSDWSWPVNLGSTINSVGDEAAPSIAFDNRTLYFSSNQHPGMGGMDMYVSKRNGTMWQTPENAGTPLNSPEDDYFYTLQLGTKNVYFASNRGNGSGGLDLFIGVPNPFPPSAVTTVHGTVTDASTKTPLGAKLTVTDIETNQPVATFYSDDVDGKYTVVLQSGKKYAITAEASNYLFYSDRFDVMADAPENMIEKNVAMSKELTRLLVFFDFDKAALQRESNVDLDNAAKWLKDNPDLHVELSGHTDNKGPADYNKRLSEERANAVRDYLIRKGVAGSRLTASGYGMEQPIATNDTEEGQAMNRRVEFRVMNR